MIRPHFALGTLILFLVMPSAAKAVNKEKLRQAISLPEFNCIFGYGFNGWGELTSTADLVPQPEKITEIENQLQGDVTDVERYFRLNSLCAYANQPDKAKEVIRKAETLLRQQLEAHPTDMACRVRLADARELLGNREEAETLLRRAVADCPDDWRGWLTLGRFLNLKSQRTILKGKSISANPDKTLQILRAASPTPEQLEARRQLCQEAETCLDRAVGLAPRQAKVYRIRGAMRYHESYMEWGLRLYKGEKADLTAAFLAPQARPDLRRAMELDFNNYLLIGMIDLLDATADACEYKQRHPSTKQPEQLIDVLSEATRQRVEEHMARLSKEMEQPDKHKAAEAAEVLAYLQLMLLKESPTTETILRRCIALDPTRNGPWEMLLASLLIRDQLDRAAELCLKLLQRKDSARTRVLLAKAYANLDRLPEAEQVVRTGLERAPDDFLLNLAWTDLLLLRGGDDDMNQAGQILSKLKNDRNPGTGIDNRWLNFRFAYAIGAGLSGQVKIAHEWLEEVRKRKPDYPHLEEALKALDE